MQYLGKRPRLVRTRAHERQLQIQEESTEHSDRQEEGSSAAAVLCNLASSEESQQDLSQIDISNLLVARDGTKWTPVVAGTNSRGRRSQQNILRECSGATSYARRNVKTNSPASAWRLFIDKFILEHIQSCTVTEAHRETGSDGFTVTIEELEAFISIMYIRGVMGKNDMPLSELWNKKWGVAFCKQVMSRDRFKEILRFLRLDKKSTRSQRLQTNKLAVFSTVWNRFIENSVACYKPGGFLTVDEQLFPSKARCPFTQFMKSKPDKYGQKYWLAVDKDSKYVANGFPYVGKDESRSTDERVSDHVVMKLAKPYLKKGRNITTLHR